MKAVQAAFIEIKTTKFSKKVRTTFIYLFIQLQAKPVTAQLSKDLIVYCSLINVTEIISLSQKNTSTKVHLLTVPHGAKCVLGVE